MRQLNKNEKILSAVVGSLLFIFIFNIIIIKPLKEKLNTAEDEILHSQLLIRKYLEIEQQKDTLVKENKKIERYLTLKGSSDEKLTAILSKIEAEARKSGLVIVDMKPDTSQKSKSLPEIYRIQLNAEADLSKIFNFVYGLENSDILFKVEKLNLSVKDESTGVMKIESNILGVAIS